MSEPPAAPEPITRYDLRVTRGGLRFHMGDRGVAAGPESLSFVLDGRVCIVPYPNIAEVNLAMFSLSGSDVAQMRISFRDGSRIVLLNTDAWGNVNAESTQDYYRFKAELHERLIAAGANHIRFTTGYSHARHTTLRVMLLLLGGIFLVLPPVLFIVTRQPQALIAMGGGILLTLPFLRVSNRNRPGTYDPRNPPDMLA